MATVAETIRELTREHLLERNGQLYAQCVRAVGWIGGTVPELTEEQGIVELPTSDASNGGIVCGAALMGRMPIYIVRYQGFMWYNAVSIVNYAAKSMEMWDQPCPVFVRAIGMDGGIGPVASHMNHSIMAHMPGIDIYAPMTPNEWKEVWQSFLDNPRPIYCSEHRASFTNDKEIENIPMGSDAEWNIIHIGPSRLRMHEMHRELMDKYNIFANHIGVFKLSPTTVQGPMDKHLRTVIIDDDYAPCSISQHIAYLYERSYGVGSWVYGIEHRTAGFAPHTDNMIPTTEKLAQFMKERW